VRVLAECGDLRERWRSGTASGDLVDASFLALVDAVTSKLHEGGAAPAARIEAAAPVCQAGPSVGRPSAAGGPPLQRARMDFRTALAAVAVLVACLVPGLAGRWSASPAARCDDPRRVERIDPLRLRGALPVAICDARGAGRFRSPRGAAALLLGHRIDLNRASAEEIADLPGVGPGTAARIVAARAAGGPFEGVDDLLRVRGLGRKRIEALRPWIRAGHAPAGRAPPAR